MGLLSSIKDIIGLNPKPEVPKPETPPKAEDTKNDKQNLIDSPLPNKDKEKDASNQTAKDNGPGPYEEFLKKLNDVNDLIIKKQDAYANTLDTLSRMAGAGTQSSKHQDIFYGINQFSQLPEVPFHKEAQGLVFFTRPDLNLNYDNISQVRQMTHLLVQDTNTPMNAVKLVLDPTTQLGGVPPILRNAQRFTKHLPKHWSVINSPLVDWRSPYINLLSNTCMSLSNPPDIGVENYTSPEGKFKEQWLMVDDVVNQNSSYNLTATFMNPKGNGVQMLFLTWILYMSFLRSGHMTAHPHNRWLNRMDYFTRIERFKFDESGTRIVQWFHTGAAVPTSINIGEGFGLQREDPYDTKSKEISAQFNCVGAVYNDPIQLWEFNLRQMKWNSDLLEGKRQEKMYKVPPDDRALLNNLGYPLINLATFEMEWWVYKEDYERATKGIYPKGRMDQIANFTKQSVGQYGPSTGSGFGKP